jgi:HlyD family secretion protein
MKLFQYANLLLLTGGAVAAGWWFYTRDERPVVRVIEARRRNLESMLATNGKVEPVEAVEIRAQAEGTVRKIHVARGEQVKARTAIVTLDQPALALELERAQAERKEAEAQLALLERGGRPQDRVAIDAEEARIAKSVADLEQDLAVTKRLVEKKAAPLQEQREIERRISDLKQQQQALGTRRGALLSPADIEIAKTRVATVQTSITRAERALQLLTVRATASGRVFQIDAKPGAFLRPGDLVAKTASAPRTRVVAQVDEPELGQIRLGMPATVRWDAQPEKQWHGKVAQLPVQIINSGTRQIGEVWIELGEDGGDLLPGMSVNVEIEVARSNAAITVPREALQQQNQKDGVYVVGAGDQLAWREVTAGQTNPTTIEIKQGLNEGERVAMPAGSLRLKQRHRY